MDWPPFMGQPVVSLAPGVRGIVHTEADGTLIVTLVVAEQPGSGAVGRYLDQLPRDHRVIVEACVSERLAGMLRRRGFTHHEMAVFNPEFGEWVDGYVREA